MPLYPKSQFPFDVVNKALKPHTYGKYSQTNYSSEVFLMFFLDALCSIIDRRLHLY